MFDKQMSMLSEPSLLHNHKAGVRYACRNTMDLSGSCYMDSDIIGSDQILSQMELT